MPIPSEKQDEIRREKKRKQKISAGKGSSQKRKQQEGEGKIPRHVTGKWSKSMEETIASEFQRNPTRPLTTGFFSHLLRDGETIVVEATEEGSVGISGEVHITNTNITLKGKVDMDMWSCSVFTSGGYGVRFHKPKGKTFVNIQ
jgi:hypothetical protein